MTKALSKFNFPGEFKALQNAVKVLGRTARLTSKLFEVTGASTKTSKEIDEAIIITYGQLSPEELNGLLISDPANHYLLVRQEAEWNLIAIGDSGWKTASLENSWTTFITVGYRLIGNRYYLHGSLLPTGSSGSSAFKMPKGPIQESIYTVAPGSQVISATVIVRVTGNVDIIYSSGTTSISLDSVNFAIN